MAQLRILPISGRTLSSNRSCATTSACNTMNEQHVSQREGRCDCPREMGRRRGRGEKKRGGKRRVEGGRRNRRGKVWGRGGKEKPEEEGKGRRRKRKIRDTYFTCQEVSCHVASRLIAPSLVMSLPCIRHASWLCHSCSFYVTVWPRRFYVMNLTSGNIPNNEWREIWITKMNQNECG